MGDLTMHSISTSGCVLDTAIHALMVKNKDQWSYKNHSELKKRMEQFRTQAELPHGGGGIEVPHDGINKFFWNMGIGIVDIWSVKGEDSLFMMPMQLSIPAERHVEHYFLWSHRMQSGGGVGYSDALAKRVGKDDFKLLWTREEVADLYDECYRSKRSTPGHKLFKTEILQ